MNVAAKKSHLERDAHEASLLVPCLQRKGLSEGWMLYDRLWLGVARMRTGIQYTMIPISSMINSNVELCVKKVV